MAPAHPHRSSPRVLLAALLMAIALLLETVLGRGFTCVLVPSLMHTHRLVPCGRIGAVAVFAWLGRKHTKSQIGRFSMKSPLWTRPGIPMQQRLVDFTVALVVAGWAILLLGLAALYVLVKFLF